MQAILPLTKSRCRGELLGDDWGHADKVCEVREHCKRYIQSVLEFKATPQNAVYVGWQCATEEKEAMIPMERQENIFEVVSMSDVERVVMCCEQCNDGDGNNIFPVYGLAPHTHNLCKTGGYAGSTVLDLKETWPSNFFEDPECEGLGTYAFCPNCKAGRSDLTLAEQLAEQAENIKQLYELADNSKYLDDATKYENTVYFDFSDGSVLVIDGENVTTTKKRAVLA